LNKYIKCNFRG